MHQPLPMADATEFFDQVTHQGKTVKVGDRVMVSQAGQSIEVEVSTISKKQNHYWVGYDDNRQFCPWPLVRVKR